MSELEVEVARRMVQRPWLARGVTVALAILLAGCSEGTTPQATLLLPPVGPTESAPSTVAPLVSSAPVATPASTSTVVGPGEAWIAASVRDMVRLIRPDGTGDHLPFPSAPAGFQYHVDWSPDGSQLSFTIRGERDIIWIGDVDTSLGRVAVDCRASCAWAHEAAWSPDGTSLIYVRMAMEDAPPSCTLEILDLVKGTTRVVLEAPERWAFGQPRWSPDGSHVVVESAEFATSDLEGLPVGVFLSTVDVTAAKPTAAPITERGGLSNSPDWSWATNRILFARPSSAAGFDGPSDLVTMNPDGSDVVVVTSVGPRDGQTPQPAWSPNGLRILFVRPDTTLMTIGIDGSELAPAIATDYGRGTHPRYRPNTYARVLAQ